MLGLNVLSVALLLAIAGAAIGALALGWRLLAAAMGLAFLLALPLVALGPAQDWWRHRRGRRRVHRVRPEGFGR